MIEFLCFSPELQFSPFLPPPPPPPALNGNGGAFPNRLSLRIRGSPFPMHPPPLNLWLSPFPVSLTKPIFKMKFQALYLCLFSPPSHLPIMGAPFSILVGPQAISNFQIFIFFVQIFFFSRLLLFFLSPHFAFSFSLHSFKVNFQANISSSNRNVKDCIANPP